MGRGESMKDALNEAATIYLDKLLSSGVSMERVDIERKYGIIVKITVREQRGP